MLAARNAAITRGKSAPNQTISGNRTPNPSACQVIVDALRPETSNERRTHVLNDPTMCSQFAITWGSAVGTLSHPAVAEPALGTARVTGSYTDAIGRPHPVQFPVDAFRGYFTTLVSRNDAEAFHLAMHAILPETIPGRPAEGRGARHQDRPDPTLERLNFPMPEDSTPGDRPVIVALPVALPLGPGQVLPPGYHLRDDVPTLDDKDKFLEVWLRGHKHAQEMNDGHSVTVGGDLFDWDDLVEDEFAMLPIVARADQDPAVIPPTDALFTPTQEHFLDRSNELWAQLGFAMEPDGVAATQPVAGGAPAELTATLDRLLTKDKPFKLCPRTKARLRGLLARAPVGAGAAVVLQELSPKFDEVLRNGSGPTAREELKELTRARITLQRKSKLAHLKATTLEAAHVTLAYSDKVRTFGYLSEKLGTTTLNGARSSFGVIHCLTPVRDKLHLHAKSESQADAIVMANSTNDRAQLDATRNSQMHSGGRVVTFLDVCTAAVNVLTHFSVMVPEPAESIFLSKLMEFADLFDTQEGRAFYELNRHTPGLAVHGYQGLQTIMTAFVKVAINTEVQDAITLGHDVDVANYRNAIAVADALINDLKVTLEGMTLGMFRDPPLCLPWFRSGPAMPEVGEVQPRPAPARNAARPVAPAAGEGGPKRQKTIEPEEVARRKELGVLLFDPQAAGSRRLPSIDVYRKKRNAKNPERLCMKFLTKGHACLNPDCKLPHVADLNSLPPADRRKLLEAVERLPGLTWVEGKAPAGAV